MMLPNSPPVGPDSTANEFRKRLEALGWAEGRNLSNGIDFTDDFARAAVYVDKILRGVKPADLPVEQADRFKTVINRGTARALGITIPQSVLVRADEVIE